MKQLLPFSKLPQLLESPGYLHALIVAIAIPALQSSQSIPVMADFLSQATSGCVLLTVPMTVCPWIQKTRAQHCSHKLHKNEEDHWKELASTGSGIGRLIFIFFLLIPDAERKIFALSLSLRCPLLSSCSAMNLPDKTPHAVRLGIGQELLKLPYNLKQ